ncbi:MAG TPA: PadR family transcriptional regulator [Solirubrobacteraceae bacterium]|jgi:DNA-binding PadR family transcriptional regulator|nr:PadR family transcriptional regulator [Solirubrobacteraceae bacterium]
MRSLVNWALLGLVIDRPSYAYELAQRFERTYEDALSLSSVSHAYLALGALTERGLIEEVPGTRSGRQPKPHYRATEAGIEQYRDWLVEQIGEERQRRRLFVLGLGALTRDPSTALQVLDRFEAVCLKQAAGTPLLSSEGATGEPSSRLIERLLNEENRLAVGAKLEWMRYAREELKRLGKSRR